MRVISYNYKRLYFDFKEDFREVIDSSSLSHKNPLKQSKNRFKCIFAVNDKVHVRLF